MRLTAAVIGLGQIGLGYDLNGPPEFIVTHSKAFLVHEGFDLVGGVDPLADNRNRFTSFTGRPAYATIPELFTVGVPDVVAIAVPTSMHLRTVEEVIPHRPKLVLLEKPMGASIAEARRISDLAKRNEQRVAVNYIRHGDPAVIRFGEDLLAGAFGDVLTAGILYSSGMFNNASHYINLLLSWFGPPRSVRGIALRRSHTGGDIDADFVLTHPSFTVHGAATNASAFGMLELDVVMAKGRARWYDYGWRLDLSRVGPDPDFPGTFKLGQSGYAEPSMHRSQFNIANLVHERLCAGDSFEKDLNLALETFEVCEEIRKQVHGEIL